MARFDRVLCSLFFHNLCTADNVNGVPPSLMQKAGFADATELCRFLSM